MHKNEKAPIAAGKLFAAAQREAGGFAGQRIKTKKKSSDLTVEAFFFVVRIAEA